MEKEGDQLFQNEERVKLVTIPSHVGILFPTLVDLVNFKGGNNAKEPNLKIGLKLTQKWKTHKALI